MKACGIIIEYNPMHLGHRYHIQQAKEKSQADIIIGVMSPQFVQRGQPAIVSKFIRTQAALENGVDIVVELPTLYALQSADTFGRESVKILEQMKVSSIVFGSETNDIETLKQISQLPINLDRLKERLALGESYQKAIALDDTQHYPNDILAMSYLRAIQDTQIEPLSIGRTNHYFDNQDIEGFVSAHDIRNHLEDERYTNQSLSPLNQRVDYDRMYQLLKYKLLSSTSQELDQIFLVSEGIQNQLKKNAETAQSFDELIAMSTSRRYSSSRISRICMHILLNHTKEMVESFQPDKVRVLGIKQEALPYLKGLNIGSRIGDFEKERIDIEINATKIYALFSEEKNLLEQEISKMIIHQGNQGSV